MYQFIKRAVTSTCFEKIIVAVIILNSLAIGLETITLTEHHSLFFKTLVIIDWVCIGIFVVEALLKILVHRQAYFKSSWNLFDFIIVVIAILPFSNFISVLRAIRIIRAFRLIGHIPALKRVIGALAISIPGMIATALLLLLVFFVFGVMGVKLFGHDFPIWFGHLGRSMYSLFQIMTLESWSMGIARPVMKVYPYAWVYFIPFILITSFMLLNFLIGIVVDAIAHLKNDQIKQQEQISLQEIVNKLEFIEKLLLKKNNKI